MVFIELGDNLLIETGFSFIKPPKRKLLFKLK